MQLNSSSDAVLLPLRPKPDLHEVDHYSPAGGALPVGSLATHSTQRGLPSCFGSSYCGMNIRSWDFAYPFSKSLNASLTTPSRVVPDALRRSDSSLRYCWIKSWLMSGSSAI